MHLTQVKLKSFWLIETMIAECRSRPTIELRKSSSYPSSRLHSNNWSNIQEELPGAVKALEALESMLFRRKRRLSRNSTTARNLRASLPTGLGNISQRIKQHRSTD